MLTKYRHISFDLDGTLVHTAPEHRHTLVPAVVQELGGRINSPRIIDQFWFEPGRDALIEQEFRVNPAAFWNLFRAKDTPELRSLYTRAYPDSEPIVRALKEAGKTVSVITGAPHYIASMELEKLNGVPIDFYCSIHDGGFSVKPHPDSLFFMLERLGMTAQETLYIGNSNEDAYFAKNAGVDFMYIDRKEHPLNPQPWAVATLISLADIRPRFA